jgi:maltose alpha-D-glucosyltransferase/alpha-amylase
VQKESWRILNGVSEGHSFFDRQGLGNIQAFLDSYMEQYLETKDKGYINLPLGNHDNARINVKRTDKELEMIYAFGMTMPGVPFVYYGNEIGMRQQYGNPNVEGAYPPRSGGRTPMQWAPGKNLGFSTGNPENLYLPVDQADDAPTVAAQENDPQSLLNKFRKLVDLKTSEPALKAYAQFVPVYAAEKTYPFIYARANNNEIILCLYNPADRTESAQFNLNMNVENFELLIGDELNIESENESYSVEMPPISYALYKLSL